MNDFENVVKPNAPSRSEPADGDADAMPAPTGLGQPRRINGIPFAQEPLPGMEAFVDDAPVAEEDPVGESVAPAAPSGLRAALAALFASPLVALVVLAVACGFGAASAFLLFRDVRAYDYAPAAAARASEPAPDRGARDARAQPSAALPAELAGRPEEAALWKAVADMKGSVGGVPLRFHDGCATAGDTTYRVLSDLCRDGEDILAKVEGDGLRIVRVAPDGTIVRTYACPKDGRTLRQVFGL